MKYTKSKDFVKGKLIEDYSINSSTYDFERDDDDDPFSFRRVSTKFLGLMIGLLTILLPSLSVYLSTSSFQENKIIINHSIKKDGS